MADKIYPPYPPCHRNVRVVDDLHRSCLVIEMLSTTKLSPGQEAFITERLETVLSNCCNYGIPVEKMSVVTEKQFDTLLLDGLRLRP